MKKDDIEKSVEYIGYFKLYQFSNRLYAWANRLRKRLKKNTDNLYFQLFKMKFGERDSDIYIVAYPKSGTTLLQVIMYQLTSKGGLDFNHIYDVSPWIRNASFKRQEPVELPSPRIIKSHDHYPQFDKEVKGRFIFVYRDGMDTAISFYHQTKNYNNSKITLDEYLKEVLKPRKKNWFHYTQQWFENEKKLPILYIRYENLLKDKEREIRRIIDFCQLDATEEQIANALHYSSFESMKQNEQKFGEQPNQKVYDQFIRKGKKGEGKAKFNPEQKAAFTKQYEQMVKSKELEIFGSLLDPVKVDS